MNIHGILKNKWTKNLPRWWQFGVFIDDAIIVATICGQCINFRIGEHGRWASVARAWRLTWSGRRISCCTIRCTAAVARHRPTAAYWRTHAEHWLLRQFRIVHRVLHFGNVLQDTFVFEWQQRCQRFPIDHMLVVDLFHVLNVIGGEWPLILNKCLIQSQRR